MMQFRDLLLQAKAGDEESIQKILEMYNPFLLKASIVLGVYDEDLYQELCMTVMHCIKTFRV